MDAAFALEKLVPTAEYFGSLTENTEEAYAALQWHDPRPKPTWAQLEAAHAAMPTPVPPKVTRRQAQLALHRAGYFAQVQPAIDQMAEPQRTEAQIEWNAAGEVERDSPLVGMLGAILGLSEAQIDALFIEAGAII